MRDPSSAAIILPLHEEPPFSHKRYDILGKRKKRGQWGVIYDVRDKVTDTSYVAKRISLTKISKKQKEERGLDERDIILKEFTKLDPPENVLGTWVEECDNGELFLLSKPYEGDLEELITNEKGDRSYLNNGLSSSQIFSWVTDMIHGNSGFHKKYEEPHCDLKPDNYFFDSLKHLCQADSGTKTGSSILSDNVTRARMGFIYTRAPENFKDSSRPELRSDVWSLGSNIYRLLTGKYILEDELDNAKDPDKFINSLDDKVLDSIIQKKLEHIPRKLRKFLSRALTTQTKGRNKRYENSMEMESAWDKTLQKMSPWHFVKSSLRLLAVPVIAGALYAATLLNTVPEVNNSYPINSNVDPESFEVTNSYADLDVMMYSKHKQLRNPKWVEVLKNEKLWPSLELYFSNLPDSLQHPLNLLGSIGFEGYDTKYFRVWTSKKGHVGEESSTGYTLMGYNPTIPEDIPEGATINLEIRIFNPDSTALNEYYKWHKDGTKLSFSSPTEYLCTKKISIHVAKKGQSIKEQVVFGGTEDYFTKQIRMVSSLGCFEDVDKSLKYVIRMPATGMIYSDKSSDNVANVSTLNPFSDLPKDSSLNDVQLIAFKDNRLVYQTFFPVRNPSPRSYSWDPVVPDTGFATRIQKYAKDTKELIKRYGK
jgi:serine/threonine protein kinase